MSQIALSIPQVGLSDQTEDPKVANDFTILQTWANGNVDGSNLSAAAAQSACINQAGQVVKGALSVAPSQSTTSATYTTLGTPDQVTGIVLPTNGLIAVWYQAIWAESVAGAARAAIFIGSNQLVVQANSGGVAQPYVQAAATGSASLSGLNLPLFTIPQGLGSSNASVAYGNDVTTGQATGMAGTNAASYEVNNSGVFSQNVFGAGGPCYIDNLPAGTYTISVRFKASSGQVAAVNRRLRVVALSFA